MNSTGSKGSMFDVVIIGAGHNGLVTACYLAKAKWKVLVLERRYLVGGACVTEENTFPGYKVSTCAYVNSLFSPTIVKDLNMPKYGFELLEHAIHGCESTVDRRAGSVAGRTSHRRCALGLQVHHSSGLLGVVSVDLAFHLHGAPARHSLSWERA